MTSSADHLDVVGELAEQLRALGLEPVLVGGMAMVVLGSRRVTRDFDLLLAAPADRLDDVVALFYDRGFELIARLTADGDVAATIDNRAVATARLRIDAPPTAYFYESGTRLRVDLLFDFPVTAARVRKHAIPTRIGPHVIRVAAERELLELKKIAAANRQAAGDAEDIAFLERRLKR